VDAAGVDRQREVLVERVLRRGDEGVAAACLDRHGRAGHPGDVVGARAGRVDDRPDPELLPGGQGDRGDLRPGAADGDDVVLDVLHAVLAGLAAQPLDHGGRVELTFVHVVVAARDDVVQVVEGKALGDVGGRKDLRAGAARRLEALVALQDAGEVDRVGEVEVAEAADAELRHGRVVTEHRAEAVDELGRVLRDPHVDLGGELLAHAVVARRRRRVAQGGVALDDQHAAVEARQGAQVPGDRGPAGGPADDHDVVAALPRAGGDAVEAHVLS
jgi:hypothetical protein